MTNPETMQSIPNLFAEQDSRPVEGKSFHNLRRFLSEGAIAPVRTYKDGENPDYHDKYIYYPGGKGIHMSKWERNLQITYAYVFTDKGYEELAKKIGLDSQVIKYILKQTVFLLWKDLPQQIKEFFPLESFDFKKPRGGPNLFEQEDAARKVFPYASWDNTLAFLSEITPSVKLPVPRREKVRLNKPKRYIPPLRKSTIAELERYNRRLELAGKLFGKDYKNFEGARPDNNNLSRERLRQVATEVLDELWQEAPTELKRKYPRELLSTDKRASIAHGRTGEVLKESQKGIDGRALNKRFGGSTVRFARRKLREGGIEITHAKLEGNAEKFTGLYNSEATDEEIQALLDKITNPMQVQALKKAGLVVGLLDVARKAGLYMRNKAISYVEESLAKGNPPLPRTKVPRKAKDQTIMGYYHLIAATGEPEAINILSQDRILDDLRINPVRLIAGPKEGKIPNTTELSSDKYDYVGNLIVGIRGRRLGPNKKNGLRVEHIIEGSPVPVYNHRKNYYYPKDQEKELRPFLENRMQELGVI